MEKATNARFQRALDLLGRAGAAVQLARAHLAYGEWLRRQRRRREARDQLHAALEMFDAMGLRCFAGRAHLELGATDEHARKREVGTPEELTPQEAQIAALVRVIHQGSGVLHPTTPPNVHFLTDAADPARTEGVVGKPKDFGDSACPAEP
jgi:hypothetical protein